MLEVAILGLLKESDLHGYELKKRLAEMLGPFSRFSFGSLYPALARLEAAGAVKAVEANETVASPMTGSLGAELAAFRSRRTTARSTGRSGKTRKVYGITARGQELFVGLLAGEASNEDDRSFSLRLAFASHLPLEARVGVLERRRAALVERLAACRTRMRSGRASTDTYTRSLMEHDTETTERDISWLDGLLAAEHAGNHAASRQEESEQ